MSKKIHIIIIFLLLPSVSDVPELQASNYGLTESQTFSTEGLLFANASSQANVNDVTDYLKKVYCNTMAVDFSAVEVFDLLSANFKIVKSECSFAHH
jgi:2-oxoglutarate dehydrogenase complex dehydrogenase (E1) component-like enzyme